LACSSPDPKQDPKNHAGPISGGQPTSVGYHAPMSTPKMKSGTLHIQTPIIRDAEVEAALGKIVWLKMECLQPIGSFKIRGIGLLCQELKSAGCTRFVSSSGGNAGYAVAYAGRELSLP
jgi:threonine dehydratase